VAARVTEAEVRSILRVVPTATSVAAEIDVATAIVDDELASAGLSTARLKSIELYLAAHFVALGIPQARLDSLDAGGVAESYRGSKTEGGFVSTDWGKQAVALDTSGKLKSASGDAVAASVVVV
jgi:hypothetical protein